MRDPTPYKRIQKGANSYLAPIHNEATSFNLGYISASKLRGSRKQEFEFSLHNEAGKQIFKSTGEVETLGFDKRRRRKSHDYVSLTALSQKPRLDLTFNLSSHDFFLVHHGGVHFFYMPLNGEILTKLLTICHMSKTYDLLSLQKIGALPVGVSYFLEEFSKKIKAARKRRFKAWNMRRRRRYGPQAPPRRDLSHDVGSSKRRNKNRRNIRSDLPTHDRKRSITVRT